MMTRASAPGKLILSGEHAVVYGHRAVAAAVSLETTVTLHDRPGPSAIDRSDLRDARLWPALAPLIPPDGVGVSIASTLPVGCGLGSSAALAVALVRALARRDGREASFEECYERGFVVERAFHGTPSGVDHTVSARGGVLVYRRASSTSVASFAPVALPRPLRLVVADTGSPGDTAAMVAAVRARAPTAALDAIGALTEQVVRGLERGEAVGALLDENHRLLQAIGVSTEALDRVVAAMRAAGAAGAKLAGAGGGGVAFALVDTEHEASVARAARACGCRVFAVDVALPR